MASFRKLIMKTKMTKLKIIIIFIILKIIFKNLILDNIDFILITTVNIIDYLIDIFNYIINKLIEIKEYIQFNNITEDTKN